MIHLARGRKVLIRLLAVVAAASVALVTYTPAPTQLPTTTTVTVPVVATVPEPLPVTPLVVLEMPVHQYWLTAQQDDEKLRLAMAERELDAPIQAASQQHPSSPPPPDTLWISAAEARGYAEAVFLPGDVDLMLSVADCEAGDADGEPSELNVHAKNPYSTASGSFQHLRGWWSGSWGSFGPFDPFDPVQSFAAAAYLLYDGGGISNWNASRHCWG